jgi:hypothetical protein
VETESKVVHTPFGENPTGVITYTPDGRMFLFIIDPKRKPPAGPKATDHACLKRKSMRRESLWCAVLASFTNSIDL